MSRTYFARSEDMGAATSCDNCGWRGIAGNTHGIKNVGLRLDPGGIVPVGECPNPNCGSLAYLDADLEQEALAAQDLDAWQSIYPLKIWQTADNPANSPAILSSAAPFLGGRLDKLPTLQALTRAMDVYNDCDDDTLEDIAVLDKLLEYLKQQRQVSDNDKSGTDRNG